MTAAPALFIRVLMGEGRLGPGKVALLEGIARLGLIAKAAAAMWMSYRRAWLLVKECKALVGIPVVETAIGGTAGGGAKLTQAGSALIAAYRSIERKTAKAAAAELQKLAALAKR
jgi:molybdate transport system regulatory protein